MVGSVSGSIPLPYQLRTRPISCASSPGPLPIGSPRYRRASTLLSYVTRRGVVSYEGYIRQSTGTLGAGRFFPTTNPLPNRTGARRGLPLVAVGHHAYGAGREDNETCARCVRDPAPPLLLRVLARTVGFVMAQKMQSSYILWTILGFRGSTELVTNVFKGPDSYDISTTQCVTYTRPAPLYKLRCP